MSALVVCVRLHDGRYHGQGDWPPSPARLFQALVAGVGLGGPIAQTDREALEWLQGQKPPIVGAPLAWRPRRGVLFYMPNNDSDAIGGDPRKTARIRTATKIFRPYFFNAAVPFAYVWSLAPEGADHERARIVCRLADSLYQLGRGIDMAWAWGEILDEDGLEKLLVSYPGRLHRPSPGGTAPALPCPCPGSLESLERRYRAFRERFRFLKGGKAVQVVFRQPPKPEFRLMSYDSPPSWELYELRGSTADAAFAPWPLAGVSALVVRLRDAAAERLTRALPAHRADIERVFIGRKPDGTNDCPPEDRVRIIPLPSIGYVHADREIRRVLVQVPPGCPVAAADVQWAFSGLDVVDPETGEIQAVLTRTDEKMFVRHYGLGDDGGRRVWRTVTPAVLPEVARRRRIDPVRRREEAKGGGERAGEHARAAAAVCQALRHAGLRTRVKSVRVQREPFEGNGARVEVFSGGTRFSKQRLWHVEVAFEAPFAGPLVIGDGRFLGLGVMAPMEITPSVHAFVMASGALDSVHPEELARALRRAVMTRVQAILDGEPLPGFFSGHEPDGRPVRGETTSHLAFACDLEQSRLLILAPHMLDGRVPSAEEREHLRVLERALEGFSELRAGAAGHFQLKKLEPDMATDPLFRAARTWVSLTPYLVTRHVSVGSAASALERDVAAELQRRGFARAAVTVTAVRALPGRGLAGSVRLDFKVPVPGPLLLGRSRYLGGGLFSSRV